MSTQREPREVALLSRARQALAEAKTIDDLTKVRQQAEAVRYAMQLHGYTVEAVNDAAELKLRAERRLGQLRAAQEKANGGRPPKTPDKLSGVSRPLTAEEQGFTEKQSTRWQRLAALPEDLFEEHVARVRSRQEALTTAGVARTVQEYTARTLPLSRWPQEERQLRAALERRETTVVNLWKHLRVVEWARAHSLLVVIDRSSAWGNPFVVDEDGDRETVIANFARYYLPHKPRLRADLRSLRGKALACHCAPAACHGDLLKAEADRCS
jgi:hypothetical protein